MLNYIQRRLISGIVQIKFTDTGHSKTVAADIGQYLLSFYKLVNMFHCQFMREFLIVCHSKTPLSYRLKPNSYNSIMKYESNDNFVRHGT